MPSSPEDDERLHNLERENQRLRRSVQELSLLNDLAREIGASYDAEEIIHKIIRRALKSVEAEQGVITLVEEREDDPMKTLVRTTGSSAQHDPYKVNDSLLGWMLLHKKPLLLQDPTRDDRFRGTRWDASIRSVLCVPLIIRAQLIGLLTVYNKKTAPGFTENDQRLLAIIAAQSAQIVENARLHKEEQELQRMREEMRLAHEIQTTLLPIAPPDVPGYDIAGASLPADTVGGDYFDFIPLAEERLGVCVADVSGKGLPAAMLMANVQATLRGQAPWSDSVAACLERANTLLCRSIRRGTFVTLVYGILDWQHHQFRYGNAGHNRPLLRTAAGEVSRLDLGDMVLGFMPSYAYQEAIQPLAPGDMLLIYSDGVTEAMNPARKQFDENRLTNLLQTHGDQPASTLINHIVNTIQQHADGAPPSDDRTLLVIRRVAKGA